MPSSDGSKNFFRRLNESRESAAEELDRRYRKQLCGLVEREMGKRFRSRVDVEDPVQSALASFFRGVEEGRFVVNSSSELWRTVGKGDPQQIAEAREAS